MPASRDQAAPLGISTPSVGSLSRQAQKSGHEQLLPRCLGGPWHSPHASPTAHPHGLPEASITGSPLITMLSSLSYSVIDAVGHFANGSISPSVASSTSSAPVCDWTSATNAALPKMRSRSVTKLGRLPGSSNTPPASTTRNTISCTMSVGYSSCNASATASLSSSDTGP
jgi:hypothetical protein